MLLGVDTGGTFTDFVVCDGDRVHFHKELSTPQDPSIAILRGIDTLCRNKHGNDLHLVHGSTVATNAILERKGVKTLLVTNHGMQDLLRIGRQTRRELYNLCPPLPEAWTRPEDCFGLHGRVDASGTLVEDIQIANLAELHHKASGYQAVAVCTLFSFLNPAQEQAAAEALKGLDVFTSLSHQVLAEYREFERASTTFLNAYVGPLVQRYLQRLADGLHAHSLFVMHSTGGVMDIAEAGKHAVRMVLSGPAGGLVAAGEVGRQLGRDTLISFDMGGTSTDVALLTGAARITVEGQIAGMPVAVPMLDIHTIGAGGGSIAWRDAAGLLRVGPESAGADPGPACYGRGGVRATVSDANVVLGRIPESAMLAGNMTIHIDRAQQALETLGRSFALGAEEMAAGVLRVAEENMAAALRVVSVQRGFDPADFALLCFGGGGGLHACALAEALGVHEVIIPVGSGAFSAMGMLSGKRQCDLSQSRHLLPEDPQSMAEAETIFAELEKQAASRMPGLDLQFSRSADVRYAGQGFHLTLPWQAEGAVLAENFVAAHLQAYGHVLGRGLEIMTLRVSAFADTRTLALPPLAMAESDIQPSGCSAVYGAGDVPHFRRAALLHGHRIDGPALLLEDTATVWLPEHWRLEVSLHGHLLLHRVMA
ncbi:MAG: methylhydantoinase [Zetaproteobacteria bacterium CG12_big_fil_rev_8_21_14_0_65_55_1124]|nr:MAG: methylhydantoinase [Zetaproteobacteria bacterium CG1_02_55_237]PIS20174.1 MAG: methylhydantoinase [Zetaproteobacteria bacterium CG08_land_8_20_14_0_20_55_17]PIW42704.1 MAG: methylhydantoinase [Zetaproteobacteria bacterium CG12_big_fil_rev_8_21_14_0_65_55_1124]PIY53718.1 MAG: methylhydantoinase [Zetaproteobacteria bacterium CG_4_10_14_0_8_um_filter_55_43]PIZ38821.1 MAG: methylhydantoinase [Zetaproteobacteria bacterium CG_4_10_14_0_2_um_filter_55_20]PJB81447.1 MAG: methylhydantoinase [Ze